MTRSMTVKIPPCWSKLLGQPSQPECAMSRYRYVFDRDDSCDTAYRTPSTYPPDWFASAHFGVLRLVTRLGIESGSMISEMRRFAYADRARIARIASM